MQYLYRYEDLYYGDHLAVQLLTFYVMKETPCGYWYAYSPHAPKEHWQWVSKDGRVRRCYDTKALAWESYRIRKQKHLGHTEHAYKMAKKRWDALVDMKEVPDQPEPITLAPHGIDLEGIL